MRRSAIFFLPLLLPACVVADSGQPLPADFVPGVVYGLTAADCAAQGGSATTDGNGLAICSLGKTEAVYACDGGGYLSQVRKADGSLLLIAPSGKVHPVTPMPAASGVLLEGKGVSLHSKGPEALFTEGGQGASCTQVK